jgi:plastocyanin
MRRRWLAAAGLVAAALAVPASASAFEQNVGIQNTAFSPAQVQVLAGDTVSWLNQSLRMHTVTSRDGLFGSPHIMVSGSFTHQFPQAGAFAYYCQIHPGMTGEIDVYDVLLKGPTQAVGRGSDVMLDGRAAAGTSNVEIQADSGSGYAPVATAAVDGTGAFHAMVTATATAKYRAVAGGGAVSPEVQVIVMDRKLIVRASRHGRVDLVRVAATPADPGGKVTLQIQSRERFGWFPVQRRKLNAQSRAVFKAPRGARVRVVLTLPDGWTPVITSPAMRLPRH